MEPDGDRKHLAFEAAHNIQTSIACGRGVIGVSLEPGTELEKFATLERTIRELVQPEKDPNPNRRAAPQTPGLWDLAGDRAGEREWPGAGPLEKRAGRGPNNTGERPAVG